MSLYLPHQGYLHIARSAVIMGCFTDSRTGCMHGLHSFNDQVLLIIFSVHLHKILCAGFVS